MMTPKEEALELYFLFEENIALNSWADANTSIEEMVLLPKQCALITVNELIRVTGSKHYYDVKKEIEKL